MTKPAPAVVRAAQILDHGGIEALADALERSCVAHVIYSSCNPTSLAADLAAMPSFDVRAARLFDMFPHTNHAEVAALLSRRPA